ncbi:MAG: hypothetical protein LWY06_07955 [Firmicutes bacterium]|nr:hypothetical protein [Bacillota bacterium]
MTKTFCFNRKKLIFLVMLFTILVCNSVFASGGSESDRLIRCTFLQEYSPEQVREFQVKLIGSFGENGKIISEKSGIPDNNVNGIKTYLIEYETTNYNGKPIKASGLLVVPTVNKAEYPVVSYQHGAILINSYGPTYLEKSGEGLFAVSIFAAKGYVVFLPDYIGCGRSKILHPFFHAATQASASLDMILASERACSDLGIKLKRGIFLTGFSQGGQSTMALQRLIEQKSGNRIKINASAPVSGPYSMTMLWDFWLNKPCRLTSILTLKTIIAYNTVYDLKLNYNEVFVKPYSKDCVSINKDVEAGRYGTEKEIEALVPPDLQNFLTKEFIEQVNSHKSPYYKALEDNNLCEWTPVSPTKLIYCADDEIIPASEALYTLEKMKKSGAKNIEAVDVGKGLNHVEAALPALRIARDWFDSFQEESF